MKGEPVMIRPLRLLFICLLVTSALFAQEEAKKEAAPPPRLDSAALQELLKEEKSVFEIKLEPLRKAELDEKLNEWLSYVRSAALICADIKIAIEKTADEAEKADLTNQLNEAQDLRVSIAERAQLVLSELKNYEAPDSKTYDEQKAYLGQFSEKELNVNLEEALIDPKKVWDGLQSWALSANGGVKWGLRILGFVGTLLAFFILGGVLARITRKAVGRLRGSSDLLKKFFVNTIRNVTRFVGLIVALTMLGVDITPFVAVFGAITFVVGFALQGTLSNFASGLMLLIYRPYDVGNYVNAGGVAGTVEEMNLVSTKLKTPDNQILVVPNTSIWSGVITNVTGSPTRRVDLVFGISYTDDVEKASQVMRDVVTQHELVLDDPEPQIEVSELADSSVNFVCRPWVKSSDYWRVKFDLTRDIKKRFDHEGISIPFPQRDIHVHHIGANGSEAPAPGPSESPTPRERKPQLVGQAGDEGHDGADEEDR